MIDMRYFIITYGCQMNKADSERLAGAFEKKRHKPTSNIDEADLIVVNMCSVRQSAVDRIFGISQKLAELKTKKPKLKTVLTGCVLRADKRKFRDKFDEIWESKEDKSSSSPTEFHWKRNEGKKEGRAFFAFAATRANKDLVNLSAKCQNKSLAFVPISNGCNNSCSYCVVPFTRGPLICRNHKEILKEIKNLAKREFKEIWLLGQNVNDYQSPVDSSINFPKLLKKVSDIPGNFKIRFTSPNPKNFSEELIETMARLNKVAKYLNLPVQSGDDNILKKMNRPYSAKQYKDLVKKIRERIPDINLSTDVIVGFPGETKKQFDNTLKLFKDIKFNIAYIAKYSPRTGTAASKLKDDIPLEEKKRREKVLRKLLKNSR